MDQNPFADNPQMQQAQKLTQYAVMLPRLPEWKKIDEAIQSQLQLVFNGEKSPEDAMKEAKKKVDELLAK